MWTNLTRWWPWCFILFFRINAFIACQKKNIESVAIKLHSPHMCTDSIVAAHVVYLSSAFFLALTNLASCVCVYVYVCLWHPIHLRCRSTPFRVCAYHMGTWTLQPDVSHSRRRSVARSCFFYPCTCSHCLHTFASKERVHLSYPSLSLVDWIIQSLFFTDTSVSRSTLTYIYIWVWEKTPKSSDSTETRTQTWVSEDLRFRGESQLNHGGDRLIMREYVYVYIYGIYPTALTGVQNERDDSTQQQHIHDSNRLLSLSKPWNLCMYLVCTCWFAQSHLLPVSWASAPTAQKQKWLQQHFRIPRERSRLHAPPLRPPPVFGAEY